MKGVLAILLMLLIAGSGFAQKLELYYYKQEKCFYSSYVSWCKLKVRNCTIRNHVQLR